MIKIDDMPRRIAVGRTLDNGYSALQIDCGEWVKRHPQFTDYRIEVKRPDGEMYFADTTFADGFLTWHINAADTAIAGDGEFQVVAIGADGERKTSSHPIMFVSDIIAGTASETPPEANKAWTDRVIEETQKSAAQAAASAAEAKETLESIPEDYTELSEEVGKLSEDIDHLTKNTAALDSIDAELIPANSNVDAYTTPGNYKVHSTADAETIANLPENTPCRLTVYESYMTDRLLQTFVTSTSVPRLYVRSYNGSKWYDWEKIITASNVAEILKNSIVSSNISITKNNYTEYFTDFNDIPVNTVYSIAQDVPLLNSPPGNNTVDRAGETSGYMAGTVLTCSGNSTSVRARFQIFMGQTSAREQSVMCFRSGYPSDGVIKWYPWQTFSDRKALTATNIAVRKEIAQEVLPSMDDAEINTIYQIDLDCDEGTIVNHPNPGQSCVLITFGFSHVSRHGMVQMCFGLGGTTKMFYRYGYVQSSTEYRWTAWEKVFTESSETSDYLVNMGRLPDGSDLNNITGNVIYLVGDNAGNQNIPTEKAGFITSKSVKNITLHTFEALTGERYSRYAVAGEWHEWVEG